MLDLSFQTVLVRLVALLVLTGLHGFLVALVARALGDKGPGYDGRLTLNPFAHLDLLAVIPFILFQAGWIRPVDVEASEVRARRAGLVAVALLALLATLAVIVLIWLGRPFLLRLIGDASFAGGVSIAIRVLFEMTVWFTVINLLPIPPLTGGLMLRAIAPAAYGMLERHGLVVRIALIAAIALGATTLLQPLVQSVAAWAAFGRL